MSWNLVLKFLDKVLQLEGSDFKIRRVKKRKDNGDAEYYFSENIRKEERVYLPCVNPDKYQQSEKNATDLFG